MLREKEITGKDYRKREHKKLGEEECLLTEHWKKNNFKNVDEQRIYIS